jgi:flagellar biosynthetic protein FliO
MDGPRMNSSPDNLAPVRSLSLTIVTVLFALSLPIHSASAAVSSAPASNAPSVRGVYDDQPLTRAAAAQDRPGQAASSDSARTAGGLDIPRVCYSLAIVVGLVLILRWVARRFLPGAATPRATSAVRLLARTPVGPKQQILLVAVGRRVLVIGDTGQQMTRLSDISDPEEVAALTAHLTHAGSGSQIEQDQVEAESAFAQELAVAGQRQRPQNPTRRGVAATMAQRLMSRLSHGHVSGRIGIAPQPAVPPLDEPQPDVSVESPIREPADRADQGNLFEITERVRKLSRQFERG